MVSYTLFFRHITLLATETFQSAVTLLFEIITTRQYLITSIFPFPQGVAADGKAFTDPEVLRRLTSSVSSALDEAAAALTRMRSQAGVPAPNHIHDQGRTF